MNSMRPDVGSTAGGGGVDPIGDVGMFKTTRDPAVAVVILIVK